MDMLTSNGNQYLRPEYLTPLPTTLDAKKSPLALLAQTCSQIGADPPSTKSLLNSLTASARNSTSNGGDHSENERSASSSSGTSTLSTTNSNSTSKSSKKAPSSSSSSANKSSGVRPPSGEKSDKSHSRVNQSLNSNSSGGTEAHNSLNEKNVTTSGPGDDKSGGKTAGSSSSSSSSSNTTTTTGTSSSSQKRTSRSPVFRGTSPGNNSPGSTSTNPGNKSPTNRAAPTSSPPDTFLSKSHESSSLSTVSTIHRQNSRSPPASKDKLNLTGSELSPLGSTSSLINGKSPSALVPFPGLYPGLPPPPLPSSVPIQPGGSAIPPYLHSYARLKAAAAAGNLGNSDIHSHNGQLSSPLTASGGNGGGCRDPFCTGCQLGAAGHLSSLAAGGSGKCPAGCISCDHHKGGSSLGSLGHGAFAGFPPLFPGFPHLPPSLASLYSSVHQSNAAAAVAASSSSSVGQPYVCNWIAGDSYCGKRFPSSEELLQHLRSHTNLSSEPGTLSSVMDRYGPPSHHLAAHNHHISRSYPTPPLSPLSSARFHPYSKPGGAPLGSLGLPQLPSSFPQGFGPPLGFSALAAAAQAAAAAANNPLNPYYPYSLYGQRLGASGLGHP